MFAVSSLAEKRVERIIELSYRSVRSHPTVGLDPVLQAVQFPACITDLDPGLPDMDADDFTLK